MRKIIFSINITIDGYADHTAAIADDELHEFFASRLDEVDVILFGRKTYEMMASYWPHAEEDPGNTKSTLKFAEKYNSKAKIVFSSTLNEVGWNNTSLSKNNLVDEVLTMKRQNGKNISAGSLSIASQLTKEGLIDEYWFLIHPVILGKGKQLFENLTNKVSLELIGTKTLRSGVTAMHYKKMRLIFMVSAKK